jgi:hypothetical protein
MVVGVVNALINENPNVETSFGVPVETSGTIILSIVQAESTSAEAAITYFKIFIRYLRES